ncbi:MAG: 4-hydroxybenzoyl-CoA reductase subunit beta [Desulfobacterium sp.]|nr:4-hydroxybenzoyl-CoA reductase subunit beta [Desulfobacterium sp.]MBU3950152.1 FAD binding domain-containing protein [Pseudomonadota bacterium]MBU4037151.1 FAD binding domain-containing protein [Pseudomonadota bacterium]
MRLPDFEYFEPETLQDAVSLLSKHKGKAKGLAGGTDLLPKLKRRVTVADALVNLQGISGLRSISEEKDILKIGALVTLGEMEESSFLKGNLSPLAQAAHAVGTVQLRNMATLGGNLCQDTRCLYYDHSHLFGQSVWEKCFKRGGAVCHLIKKGKKCFAVYSGDVAPVLLALGARVLVIGSAGERMLDLSQIYSGKGEQAYALSSEDLIAEIHVPKPSPLSYGAYVKYRERGSIDFPIVGVAAYLKVDGERINDANIWLTSVGSAPVEAIKAEAVLREANFSADLIEEASLQAHQEITPYPNHGYSAWYLKEMVTVFVKRACMKAWEDMKGGQA